MAHIRQSRPDSDFNFQVKALQPFRVVPSAAPREAWIRPPSEQNEGWQTKYGVVKQKTRWSNETTAVQTVVSLARYHSTLTKPDMEGLVTYRKPCTLTSSSESSMDYHARGLKTSPFDVFQGILKSLASDSTQIRCRLHTNTLAWFEGRKGSQPVLLCTWPLAALRSVLLRTPALAPARNQI